MFCIYEHLNLIVDFFEASEIFKLSVYIYIYIHIKKNIYVYIYIYVRPSINPLVMISMLFDMFINFE